MSYFNDIYYLGNTSTTTTNTILTSTTTWPVNGAIYARDPLWDVQVLASKPKKSVADKPEDALAWLRRRVDEVCWVPA